MGISHGRKSVHRTLFFSAFRFLYGNIKKKGHPDGCPFVIAAVSSECGIPVDGCHLWRHGNLPRAKNVPPARFLNALSIPVRRSNKKKKGHPDGCPFPSSRCTEIRIMPPLAAWESPTAYRSVPRTLRYPRFARAGLSIPVRQKKTHTEGVCLFLVNYGARNTNTMP